MEDNQKRGVMRNRLGIDKNITDADSELYKSLLDEATDCIYVCDAKSYELLYVNVSAARLAGSVREKLLGRKCYNAFFGREEPCSFCKVNKMNTEEFCIREFYNSPTDKYYVLKGKKILWNQIEAHIEYISDDTFRVKANKQMKLSEDMMKAAIEHAGLHYWDYDILHDVSAQGFTSQRDFNMPAVIENYSKVWPTIAPIAPECIGTFMGLLDKIKMGIPECSAEVLMYKDGNPVWMNVKLTTIYDEAGNPIKALGSAANIHARKIAELKFEEEVKRRLLLENNLVAIASINLSTNTLVEYSSKVNEIIDVGVSVEEMIERVADYIPYKTGKNKFRTQISPQNLWTQYKKSNSSFHFEYRRRQKNGSIRWVSTVANIMEKPLTDEVMVYLYTEDVHDSRVTMHLMSKAVESDYDYITYIDADTNNYISYLNYNSGTKLPMSGGQDYEKDFVNYLEEIVCPEEREEIIRQNTLSNICRELEKKQEFNLYFTTLDKNGNIRKKKSRYMYLDREAHKLMLTTNDITHIYEEERRKQEALRVALNNAERTNRATELFFSAMSHDIRTPMNGIVGMMEMARRDIHNEERLKEDLNIIDISSRHLLALINDVLDMSKTKGKIIESGDVFIDIEEELNEIQTIVRPMFENKKQKFQIIRNIQHKKIISDGVKIKRIVLNLLNNSSKFTPEYGTITLSVREPQIIDEGLSKFLIVVEDNGIGIRKSLQNEVFNPFVRGDKMEIGKTEGSGLGLSIVKSIVESKGGNIRLESREGKGTRITIEMPLRLNMNEGNDNKAVCVCDKSSETKIDFKGISVLLVEDNHINQMVATRIFEAYGAEIEVASYGEEGVEKFLASEAGTFDYIFMDIQMSGMDGYEATEKIRNSTHPQAETIPIIAMTANTFAKHRIRAEEAGMNGYITKPIRAEEIYNTMQAVKGMK